MAFTGEVTANTDSSGSLSSLCIRNTQGPPDNSAVSCLQSDSIPKEVC